MDTINFDGFAVELYFDAVMEANIRAFRDSVYQKGIRPNLGRMNDKPHVSLAVFGKTDPGKLTKLTNSFAVQYSGFEVKLSAVGVFPTTENVLFLSPSPSFHLLTIHRSFHQELTKWGLKSSTYYLPGNWVPHCTVEFELSDAQLKKAVLLSKNQFVPLTGRATSLGVIAFRPITYLADFELSRKE